MEISLRYMNPVTQHFIMLGFLDATFNGMLFGKKVLTHLYDTEVIRAVPEDSPADFFANVGASDASE